VIFRYVFENLFRHALEIASFAYVSWVFLRRFNIRTHHKSWATMISFLWAAVYIQRAIAGNQTTESWAWVGISMAVGLGTGALIAFRQRPKPSEPSPDSPEPRKIHH
jgi:hypothetical protein